MPIVTLPKHIDFNLHTLKELMVEVQAALWSHFYDPMHLKVLQKMVLDVGKSTLLVKGESFTDLDGNKSYVPVAGTVSLTPSQHCLPLCAAWQPFLTCGSNCFFSFFVSRVEFETR